MFADYDWQYTDNYFAKRFYLHSLVNYDFALHWYDVMERNQYTSNQFMLNVGSVSLNKLDTLVRFSLNKELNRKIWFRAFYHKIQKHDLLSDENEVMMSFDLRLNKSLYIFLTGNADYDKSKVNAQLGIMYSHPTKAEKYLRLAIELSEFVYDFKNELEGNTIDKPYRLLWLARFGNEKHWFYSEGNLMRAFLRRYPESDVYTLRSQKFRNSFADLKYYRQFGDLLLLQAAFGWRDYLDKQKHSDFSFQYKRRLFKLELRVEYELESYLLRPEIRYLRHYSAAEGLRDYTFQRREVITAVFAGRKFHKQRWEVGYLTTYLTAKMKGDTLKESNKNEQKMLLGWSCYFSDIAILRFSVSHVFEIHGFGGGNMQFILKF